MAKKFSIVTLKTEEEVSEIFLRGFVEPKQLCNSKSFLEKMGSISEYINVNIEIEQCLLLDFPDENVDISIEDLNALVNDFEYFFENDYIYLI
jgi:hypothetical protein